MDVSSVIEGLQSLARSSTNTKAGASAAIITGTLQKGQEMDSTLRSTAMKSLGKGVHVNVAV